MYLHAARRAGELASSEAESCRAIKQDVLPRAEESCSLNRGRGKGS